MDPVVQRFTADHGELPQYEAGSAGPAAVDALLADGDEWRAI